MGTPPGDPVARLSHYQVTDHGLADAVFLTRLRHRPIRTSRFEPADPDLASPLQQALDKLNTKSGATQHDRGQLPRDPR